MAKALRACQVDNMANELFGKRLKRLEDEVSALKTQVSEILNSKMILVTEEVKEDASKNKESKRGLQSKHSTRSKSKKDNEGKSTKTKKTA